MTQKQQLYGLARLSTDLRMGMHPALRWLGPRKKRALLRLARQSKLTRVGDHVYTNTFTPPWPSLAYDRYLEGVLAGTRGQAVPVVTNFALTARCVCQCWHCSFSNREVQGELSTQELVEAVGQVQDLGAAVIGFTGGEPLLRKDLEEIIASVGPRSTSLLFTTGWDLDRDRVRRLKQAGLGMAVLSLDHHTAERHDAGRGRQGTFERTLAAIRLFQEEGFYTAVSFVPTRELLDDREDFFRTLDFFRDLGLDDMRLTSPILSGKLTHDPAQALEERHRELVFEAQRMLVQTPGYPNCFAYDWFESERFYGCVAGYNYLFVDSKGHVSPCDFTMMSLGSLREEPVDVLWERMSSRFHTPGLSCYASRIAAHVAEVDQGTWPLPRPTSEAIHDACPCHEDRLPRFYREMGFARPERAQGGGSS